MINRIACHGSSIHWMAYVCATENIWTLILQALTVYYLRITMYWSTQQNKGLYIYVFNETIKVILVMTVKIIKFDALMCNDHTINLHHKSGWWTFLIVQVNWQFVHNTWSWLNPLHIHRKPGPRPWSNSRTLFNVLMTTCISSLPAWTGLVRPPAVLPV